MPAKRANTQAQTEGLLLTCSSKDRGADSAAAKGTLGFKGEVSTGPVVLTSGVADKDFNVSRFFLSSASCSVLS